MTGIFVRGPYVSRHRHEAALQRLVARTTPQHMRLRRETVQRPLAELKWRILGHRRFFRRGRHGGELIARLSID
jgi:hypothetical protein